MIQTIVKDNIVEFSTKGKFGVATITRNAVGERSAHLTFKPSGRKVHIGSDRVNLQAMKVKNLREALEKAIHSTGRISLYKVVTFRGTKALARTYSTQTRTTKETGYGLILKRGEKVLSFPLAKVNLKAMQTKSAVEAVRKAAFTGEIALLESASA